MEFRHLVTASGVEFARQARLVIAQMDQAVERTRATAAGQSGALNVSYNFPASRHVLPSALATMNERHPKVVVSLCEMRTSPQLDGLTNGSVEDPHRGGGRSVSSLGRTHQCSVCGVGGRTMRARRPSYIAGHWSRWEWGPSARRRWRSR